MIVLWAVGIAAILMAGGLILLYNALVRLRVRTDNAWSDIDVQLKRRHDLVPNLVETVKGYAAHESETFQSVVEARSQAISAQGPAEASRAEGFLTEALKSLFAVAEAYPELRATENFQRLQQSLSEIEDSIQNSRRYYNAVVRDYNTRISVFPSNLVAGLFGFHERQFFSLPEGEEAVPKVSFQDTP